MPRTQIRPEFRRLSDWLSRARTGLRAINTNPLALAQAASAWELLEQNLGNLESDEAEEWAKTVLRLIPTGSGMPAGGLPEIQKRLSRQDRAMLRDLVQKLDRHVDKLYCNRGRR
jgi:hypothetical protein